MILSGTNQMITLLVLNKYLWGLDLHLIGDLLSCWGINSVVKWEIHIPNVNYILNVG